MQAKSLLIKKEIYAAGSRLVMVQKGFVRDTCYVALSNKIACRTNLQTKEDDIEYLGSSGMLTRILRSQCHNLLI